MKSWNAERGQGWFEHPSLSRSGLPPVSTHAILSLTSLHTRTFLLSHQPSHKSLPSLTHFLLPLFLPSISGSLIFFPLIRPQTPFLIFFWIISFSLWFHPFHLYPMLLIRSRFIKRLNGDPDPSFFCNKKLRNQSWKHKVCLRPSTANI